MKRLGAAVLAGTLGLFLMGGEAFAWYYSGYHGGHYGYGGRYGHRYRHGGHFYGYRYRHYGYSPYRHYGHSPYAYGHAGGESHRGGAVEVAESGGTGGIGGGGALLGAILGGVGGGVIGHQIGGGSGRTAATVVGSLLGVVIGSNIGGQLDAGDRTRMARATQDTLEKAPSGTTGEWTNPDTGRRGTVVAKPAFKNAQGQVCREFQQKVIVGGEEVQAHGTACRQPGGQWKITD